MRKIITAALVAVLSISALTPVFAAPTQAQNTAQILYEKGILNGTGIDGDGNAIFDLERSATRAEAVTLLVTLMGKTDEAKSSTINIPFTDIPNWAAPFVSYAYNKGIVSGVSETSFAANDEIPKSQYLTMVLNALGYSAGEDFLWKEAQYLAKDVGLVDEIKDGAFLREDIVLISHRALYTKMKNSDLTLAESLGISLSEDKGETVNEALAIIKARYGFDVTFDSKVTEESKLFVLDTFYTFVDATVPDSVMRDLAKYRRTIAFTIGGEASLGSSIIKLPIEHYNLDSDYKKSLTVETITQSFPTLIGKYCAEKHWRNIPEDIDDSEFEKLVGQFIFMYNTEFKDGKLVIKENHAENAMRNYDTGGSAKGVIRVQKKLNTVFSLLCTIYDLSEKEAAIIDPNGYRIYK